MSSESGPDIPESKILLTSYQVENKKASSKAQKINAPNDLQIMT